MKPIQALRFRYVMSTLEPYFANGRLLLLHCNYGYLAFTSSSLHDKFGKKGNGQWGDISDQFYFTISFDGEDKYTLKEKGIDIELWDYGYQDQREEINAKVASSLPVIYSKKGFDLLYKKTLTPFPEKVAEQESNNAYMKKGLEEFLQGELRKIEALLLS